jgi:transcriptional regulator with XRE-family HTH domain
LSEHDEARAVQGLQVTLLRSLRHWSQADLAKATGIQKSQISEYERWKATLSETTLMRIASGVRISWFDASAALPAVSALYRMSIRPAGQQVTPKARKMAAEVGQVVADELRRSMPAILREHLPILAGLDQPSSSTAPPERGDDRAALGLLIVLLRSLRHWTQEDLANASGVQRSQISAYELWKKTPTKRTLERLAAAVGVSLDQALDTLPFLRDLDDAAQGRSRREIAISERVAQTTENIYRLEMAPLLAELFPDLYGAESDG